MTNKVTPTELRRRWRAGEEVALLDVREEGPYSLAHPFFAVSLPLSQIELRIGGLVPRLTAPVVVYDNGEGFSERAAARIAALGYTDVSVLDGGLEAYARAGEVFRDVNVPSKAFGELVEAIRHTPSLSANEAKALIEAEPDLVVLDARRFEEYRTMSIPRGISVPGGELAFRAREIAPSADTTIIVNCAGRTRSIIGTQSLINAGLKNKIFALRNGTIGWTLAGHRVERGNTDRFLQRPGESYSTALTEAKAWAERVGVSVIDRPTLDRFVMQKSERTLYLLDVRTREEYAHGHPANFISAPGGQLVQATDEWVAVRGGRLVLFDDDGVRARMTASWLVQMGWEAHVVGPDVIAPTEAGTPLPLRPTRPDAGPAAIDVVLDLRRRPPQPRRRSCLLDGEVRAVRADTVHPLERQQISGGIDHRDGRGRVALLRARLRCLQHRLGSGLIERHDLDGLRPQGLAEHRRQESNDDSRFHHGELISFRREEAVAESCVNPTFPGQARPSLFRM